MLVASLKNKWSSYPNLTGYNEIKKPIEQEIKNKNIQK